jgi:hypothetical protein
VLANEEQTPKQEDEVLRPIALPWGRFAPLGLA